MRKQRFPPAIIRLLNNVIITESDCWEWQGALLKQGYGTLRGKDGRQINAHRLSHLLFKGDIAEGLHVCHTCDNRKCVNPDHLFLGSASDNMKDCFDKGRSKNTFKIGHIPAPKRKRKLKS